MLEVIKKSQEQIPKATNINEFGFDLERDLIKSVTGKCNDEKFDSVWMSIPEVINWEGVNEFIYTRRIYV